MELVQDGKPSRRVDWATEYEPRLRQAVQEGKCTREEYRSLLDSAGLLGYFPEVRPDHLPGPLESY